MLRLIQWHRVLVWICVACLPVVMSTQAADRTERWKQVDSLIAATPQSALKLVLEMEPAIREEGAWAEAARALSLRLKLEAQTHDEEPSATFQRWNAELQEAPEPIRPLIRAFLATGLWNHYQRESWAWAERKPVASSDEQHLDKWDLPRLFREIDVHFQVLLANREKLFSEPADRWRAVLQPAEFTPGLHPTLFDIIASRAIEFYQSPMLHAIHAGDRHVVGADGPVFGSVQEFTRWVPFELPETSLIRRCLAWHQAALRFHADDTDPSAHLWADRRRIEWSRTVAVGSVLDARHASAIEQLATSRPAHPVCLVARTEWAEAVRSKGDPRRAREILLAGVQAAPEGDTANGCRALIDQIELPGWTMASEWIWNAPMEPLHVETTNVRKLYFRIAQEAWDGPGNKGQGLDERGVNPDEVPRLAPIRSWSVDIPDHGDYLPHRMEVPVPTDLPPGRYRLMGSLKPDFTPSKNIVQQSVFWVSDVALSLRQLDGAAAGLVTDARTGEPISDARIRIWRTPWNKPPKLDSQRRTDGEGRFVLAGPFEDPLLVEAEFNGHLAIRTTHIPRSESPTPVVQSTLVFTDRGIYRPGQSIHFKGLCVEADQARRGYTVVRGAKVSVELHDARNQVQARSEFVSGDLGSFAGTFVAPASALPGDWSIQVTGGPRGSASFSVEEYKRPKFEVTVEPSAGQSRLGSEVSLPIRAQLLAGAPVDGAAYSFEVVREPRWRWWYWRPAEPAVTVASGEGTLGADGTATIRFNADPPPDANLDDDLTFDFKVSVVVTDSAGETREDSRTLSIGTRSLNLELSLDPVVYAGEAGAVKINASSIPGEPQSVSGKVTLYRLQEPAGPKRRSLVSAGQFGRMRYRSPEIEEADGSNPLAALDSWPLGERIAEHSFSTSTNGLASLEWTVDRAGAVRWVAETTDAAGKKVERTRSVLVIDRSGDRFVTSIPYHLAIDKSEWRPGETFQAVFGTGYPSGRAFVEFVRDQKVLRKYWTRTGRTQETIELPIEESMRGGLSLVVLFIHENRLYGGTYPISVPWKDRELAIEWEHIRSKLDPGAKETWTAIVTSPNPTAIEMVATLFDASLNTFRPLVWPGLQPLFYHDSGAGGWTFGNRLIPATTFAEMPLVPRPMRPLLPDQLDPRLEALHQEFVMSRMMMRGGRHPMPIAAYFTSDASKAGVASGTTLTGSANAIAESAGGDQAPPPPEPPAKPAEKVAPPPAPPTRRNLQESAFFLPHVRTDAAGRFRFEFSVPESLTRWQFAGFAHDRFLRSGSLSAEAVTRRDLMVMPNAPRFLRHGDVVDFPVRLVNTTDQPLDAAVQIDFLQEGLEASANERLQIQDARQSVVVPARSSISIAWRLHVPDDLGWITYRVTGASGGITDGEEAMLPVLPRHVLVNESVTVTLRGAESRDAMLTNLLHAASSPTLRHQQLTIQSVSQPAWYSVLALPYLMEFPHECAEQTFNRLYANVLASHLAGRIPSLPTLLQQWAASPAKSSPLEQNSDLKQIALSETPWVRHGRSETEQRRHIAKLLDRDQVDAEIRKATQRLREVRMNESIWPWFPGGRGNAYISMYIVSGYARLRSMGIELDDSPAQEVLQGLDEWLIREHEESLREKRDLNPYLTSLYLYGRSFYRAAVPLAGGTGAAWERALQFARTNWFAMGGIQTHAQLALAFHRLDETEVASTIVRSLLERSVSRADLGRYWAGSPTWWRWQDSGLESHAWAMEAIHTVARDAEALADCQIWLIQQKRTHHWPSTRSTADAIHALMLGGSQGLASAGPVEIHLGDRQIKPAESTAGVAEAGTGYWRVTLPGSEVIPTFGHLKARNPGSPVAWASLHWQYLEDVSRVGMTSQEGLVIRKKLYREDVSGAGGKVLTPVESPLKVGDRLITRLEITTDRDLEFVHLRNLRGSGMEPENVLSGYRWEGTVGYYFVTRDSADHCFMDVLPRGTHVVDIASRVQLAGEYTSGLAEIECMYAPEYRAHSDAPLVRAEK